MAKILEKAHDLLARIASKNIKGRRYDEHGKFFPDPTPIAPPIGYKRSPSIAEQIRTMIRSEHLRVAAESAGAETFEEADDFNVADDYDPRSPWEEQFEGQFDMPLVPAEAPPRDPQDRNPPTPPPPAAQPPAAAPAPPADPPGTPGPQPGGPGTR